MSGRGRHFDAIVIGAGLSGLTAAAALADAGARVGVFAKGGGFLHFTSGCVDVMGRDRSTGDPLQAIEDLIQSNPRHPYARAGKSHLLTGLQHFRTAMTDGELPFGGSEGANTILPTAIGSTRATYLAPNSMAAGATDTRSSMLIVGFRGFRDFYPPYLAANLGRASQFAVRYVYLDVPQFRNRRHLLSLDLARAFDDASLRHQVAAMVNRNRGNAGRVGFPAVIGLDRPAEAALHLSELVGLPIFEIPTLPPSVPGIRINTVLRRRLLKKGARVEVGFWLQGRIDGGRAREIVVHSAGQPTVHSADAFVLATGGVGGGGIQAQPDGSLRETVFGLPVEGPMDRTVWLGTQFLGSGLQPLSSIGLTVDDSLRAVDDRGTPLENVFVTAANLPHWDAVREGSGEGVALATTHKAVSGVLDILGARTNSEQRGTIHVSA